MPLQATVITLHVHAYLRLYEIEKLPSLNLICTSLFKISPCLSVNTDIDQFHNIRIFSMIPHIAISLKHRVWTTHKKINHEMIKNRFPFLCLSVPTVVLYFTTPAPIGSPCSCSSYSLAATSQVGRSKDAARMPETI